MFVTQQQKPMDERRVCVSARNYTSTSQVVRYEGETHEQISNDSGGEKQVRERQRVRRQ